MNPTAKLIRALALTGATFASAFLLADTVETADGSRIQGKILKIDGGVIEIETSFAGVIKVAQANATSVATTEAVYLRVKGGNTVQGTVSTAAGEVSVAGTGASATAKVANVEAVWLKPEQSPEARALAAAGRHWAFEAAVDVLGKSGNTDSFASALGFTATLASSQDKLTFYAAYARAEQEGNTTADQAKGGVDYSSNFSGIYSWYVREEIGTDKIQGLDFYSNTAAGIGFDVIKKTKQKLTLRTGLAYRYESYTNGTDVSSPALDLALIHDYTTDTWKIGNRITWLPTTEDFGVYRLLHDSFFETPLAASQWKVRIGIAHDYNSEPLAGKKELDTTYYTKFLLNWK